MEDPLWSLRDTNNRKCKELLTYKRGRNKFPNKLINGITFLVTISRLLLIIVYRPLYSAKHAVTTSTFFTEPFTDYLESLVMSSEPLIIFGDFNIRMDLLPVEYTGVDGSHEACLSTTHELGHTLDLITTRTSDKIIAACPCIGELFSDHFPVFSQIRSNRPQANVTHVQFRKMKSIDPNQFSEAIPSSQLNHYPPNDLDSLVSCYNESIRSQLDMYVPVLTRDINVRSLAAWFNEDIRNAKRLRRNAEKTWRATRLPVDLAAFKKERNRVVNLMNETRRVYYNQFIEDNSTDQRRLFAASKSSLNMKKDRSLPHIPFHFWQTIWVSFFIAKITNIRSKLNGILAVNARAQTGI